MNEIIDAVSARIKSPYFGYSLLAFIAFNWRAIFLLAATEGTPAVRLAAFDSATNNLTLIVFPFVTGAIVAIAAHWIRLGFGLVARRPGELLDNMQLEAEHKRTIRKTEFERSRSELFAAKEKELIERAKRDEQVLEIEDDDIKRKLAAEIENLRSERDSLSRSHGDPFKIGYRPTVELNDIQIDLLKAAASSTHGVITVRSHLGGRSMHAGTSTFGTGGAKDFARHQEALNSLLAKSMVQRRGEAGGMYELTDYGWKVADSLLK